MAGTMTRTSHRKNGNFELHRGDLYATRPTNRVPRLVTPLIVELDRRIQEAVLPVTNTAGVVPSRGIYDIRCGLQHPARVLGRRCVEMRNGGAPIEQTVAVFEAGASWVREVLYAEHPTRGRAA